MAKISQSDALGLQICKILGMDSEHVSGLYLILKSATVAEVRLRRWLTDSEGEKIKQVLEHYKIVEK